MELRLLAAILVLASAALLTAQSSSDYNTYTSPVQRAEELKRQRAEAELRHQQAEAIRLKNQQIQSSRLAKITRDYVDLDIPADATEKDWAKALSRKLNGKTEKQFGKARVDIATARTVIEVDRLQNLDEAYGQALRYAVESKKRPQIAVILPKLSPQALAHIDYMSEVWSQLGHDLHIYILTSQ